MAVEITSLQAEALVSGVPAVGVASLQAEALVSGVPAVGVTSLQAEALVSGVPAVGVTSLQAEALVSGVPAVGVTNILIEIVMGVLEPPMIPSIKFPTLGVLDAGFSWSVHRRPINSTRVSAAASGRDVRTPLYAQPLYEFDLTYSALNSDSVHFQALVAESLQQIMGFFLQCQGQYGSFLFSDPDFNEAIGASLGVGDGATMQYPLLRQLGPYSEPVQVANVVSQIYLNGVAQESGWTVQNGNQIVFSTPPAKDAVVTADFTYYFVCRFMDDIHDYEEFMYKLHSLQSCKIRSVRMA